MVAPQPEPPVIAPPALPIADLTDETPPAEIVRAYAQTVETLKSHIRELNLALDAYRARPQ